MSELVSSGLVALSAVFFVVDPIGVVPIFIAMTHGDSQQEVRNTARRASLVAFGLLVFFALFGTLALQGDGVEPGRLPRRRRGGAADHRPGHAPRPAVGNPDQSRRGAGGDREGGRGHRPLALPLLAGPGAIATVMVLVSRGKGIVNTLTVVGAVVVTMIATYLLLRAASLVQRVLGQSGVATLPAGDGLAPGGDRGAVHRRGRARSDGPAPGWADARPVAPPAEGSERGLSGDELLGLLLVAATSLLASRDELP